MNWKLVVGGFVGAMLLLPKRQGSGSVVHALPQFGNYNLPRGIRNNNPGNLRIGPSGWQNKVPIAQNSDGEFEQFYSYEYGIRAMTKLLINYMASGRDTIASIITKYAPATENNTRSYIQKVSQRTGYPSNMRLNPSKPVLEKLVEAMAWHENRRKAITSIQFDTAWALL